MKHTAKNFKKLQKKNRDLQNLVDYKSESIDGLVRGNAHQALELAHLRSFIARNTNPLDALSDDDKSIWILASMMTSLRDELDKALLYGSEPGPLTFPMGIFKNKADEDRERIAKLFAVPIDLIEPTTMSTADAPSWQFPHIPHERVMSGGSSVILNEASNMPQDPDDGVDFPDDLRMPDNLYYMTGHKTFVGHRYEFRYDGDALSAINMDIRAQSPEVFLMVRDVLPYATDIDPGSEMFEVVVKSHEGYGSHLLVSRALWTDRPAIEAFIDNVVKETCSTEPEFVQLRAERDARDAAAAQMTAEAFPAPPAQDDAGTAAAGESGPGEGA